jgi:hypothetical protein
VDVQREGPAWLGTVGKAMAVKTAHHPEFGWVVGGMGETWSLLHTQALCLYPSRAWCFS